MEFVGENYEVKKRYFSCDNANQKNLSIRLIDYNSNFVINYTMFITGLVHKPAQYLERERRPQQEERERGG